MKITDVRTIPLSYRCDKPYMSAVRRVLGREAKLMVDINCAWSPARAIQMGRALEPQNLY